MDNSDERKIEIKGSLMSWERAKYIVEDTQIVLWIRSRLADGAVDYAIVTGPKDWPLGDATLGPAYFTTIHRPRRWSLFKRNHTLQDLERYVRERINKELYNLERDIKAQARHDRRTNDEKQLTETLLGIIERRAGMPDPPPKPERDTDTGYPRNPRVTL